MGYTIANYGKSPILADTLANAAILKKIFTYGMHKLIREFAQNFTNVSYTFFNFSFAYILKYFFILYSLIFCTKMVYKPFLASKTIKRWWKNVTR